MSDILVFWYNKMHMCFFFFFFFKQKTAYEMRISDWSSDVCSSDLRRDCFELVRLDDRAGGIGGTGDDDALRRGLDRGKSVGGQLEARFGSAGNFHRQHAKPAGGVALGDVDGARHFDAIACPETNAQTPA